jgi:hypothetical protein
MKPVSMRTEQQKPRHNSPHIFEHIETVVDEMGYSQITAMINLLTALEEKAVLGAMPVISKNWCRSNQSKVLARTLAPALETSQTSPAKC